ncbi:MAG: competence/damage-inducible protein A [Epsilonproteobacteria bacterium]|nr:competence/damage-inducible protein A [Campylobacterota bacterium]
MNIYAVIIGTEILNGRREDKHFHYLRDKLQEYGYTLFASFVIKDDKELMKNTYTMIKNDPKSVMFSFGGIGSTPDDLTRDIASEVFRSSSTKRHEKFFNDIIEKFGDEAYPHRIHMADLPPSSKLLPNPINNMSGFYLDEKYFFMPGFPQMSHPMVDYILEHILKEAPKKGYRKTLKAKTSENELIDVMKEISPEVEMSSLPIINGDKREVEISVAGDNEELVTKEFQKFIDKLKNKKIIYSII